MDGPAAVLSPAAVTVTQVAGSADRATFLTLPDRLYRDLPHFVAPLRMEQRQMMSARHNVYMRHASVACFLARRGGAVVGRISAQVDPRFPDLGRGKVGHWGMLACVDDPTVVAALLAAAEAWLRAQDMAESVGPFSLSMNDVIGLLIDGHDTPPMMLMGHDPAFLPGLVERAGYAKRRDLIAYVRDGAPAMPPAVQRLLDRPAPPNLVIRRLDMARYRAEVQAVSDIFNDAWADNWGFTPMDAEETDQLARQLKLLLEPDLVWFAELDGRPVGFIVCLPNLNEAIADLGGRLLPFGWAKLLWRLKRTRLRTGRVPLMGVMRSVAHSDASGLLASLIPFKLIDAVQHAAVRRGMQRVELSWILEDNAPMRAMIEAVGGVPYKTYRIYGKLL